MRRGRLLILLLLLGLGACKTDLYTRLDEGQANQMMALLLYHQIPVEKLRDKDGIVLRVEQSRFVEAEELLRQNGLPQRRVARIEDLFPSGQLVSSPEQEEAKLRYLKSQQMEKMLASMEGVITAEVSVAQTRNVDGEASPPASASVLIKYSPAVNLDSREGEIRALISDGIPGLAPERVSLVLQRAGLRRMDDPPPALPWWRWLLAGLALALGTGLLLACGWTWRRQRGRA